MDFGSARERMVRRQLAGRGIDDERVLAAMGAIPREAFVPESIRSCSYDDGALPIGHEQTISQPWVVAAICQALELRGIERVLEIGTGSGYSAAVLARLAESVISVERIPELAHGAAAALGELGVENVRILTGDGSTGHESEGPYDAIAVHAASPDAPHSMLAQLADGGRLVVPITAGDSDLLTLFRRDRDSLRQDTIGPTRFVRLLGAEGFDEG